MKNLKKAREQANLTQQELAKLIHVTTTGYQYYESGKRKPTIETMIRLSEILNVSIDYLVGNPRNERELDIKTYAKIKDHIKQIESLLPNTENEKGE